MTTANLLLVLSSVLISALAQIALKLGTSSDRMRVAMQGAGLVDSYGLMLASPLVIGGLLAYVFGALIWLKVLSVLDVSQAFPFTALGVVLTMGIGFAALGEPVHATRLVGAALIVAGVVLVGWR